MRWVLLVLLWALAGTVFVVLDLYGSFDEFDAVRPRSAIYVEMRRAAHERVGRPDPGHRAEPDAERWQRISAALRSTNATLRYAALGEVVALGPRASRLLAQLEDLARREGTLGVVARVAVARVLGRSPDLRELARGAATAPSGPAHELLVRLDPARGRLLAWSQRDDLRTLAASDPELLAAVDLAFEGDTELVSKLVELAALRRGEALQLVAGLGLRIDPIPAEFQGVLTRRLASDPLPDVWSIATSIAGSRARFADPAGIFDALAVRFAEADSRLRCAILAALPARRSLDPAWTRRLAEALSRSGEAKAALAAIQELGDAADPLVAVLATSVRDEGRLRPEVLVALVEIGSPTAVEVLVRAAERGTAAERTRILTGLARTGENRNAAESLVGMYRSTTLADTEFLYAAAVNLDPSLAAPPVRDLLAEALASPNPDRRLWGVRALARARHLDGDFAGRLLHGASDVDARVRAAALASFEAVGSVGANPEVRAGLLALARQGAEARGRRTGHPDRGSRAAFLDVVVRSCGVGSDVREVLRGALRSDDLYVRRAAMRAFWSIVNPVAADREAVQAATSDDDSLVRRTALQLLERPRWSGS